MFDSRIAARPGETGPILIVEDHEMLAQALALGLAGSSLIARVAEVSSPDRVLSQAAGLRPSLVLLDLDLGAFDGLDLIQPLRGGGATVLVVSGCADESRLAEALVLGAKGWVSKSEPFEQLLAAAELALHDRPLLPAARQQELLQAGRERLASDRELRRRLASLTEREREVLAALSAGRSAQQIADQFVLSLGTVRSHIRAILTKLGVSTQLAAVAAARRDLPGWRADGRAR